MPYAIGDIRTATRGEEFIEQIAATGSVVIRKVGESRAGERAFHRFLSSPYVSQAAIVATLSARTAQACADRTIVAVQDTTEINFHGRAGRRRGFGPGGNGSDPGLLLHAVIAVDRTDEAVVGLVGAESWTRAPAPVTDRHKRAYADKESARWGEGCRAAQEVLAAAASITVVGDRESDIYEVFAERPARIDLVVRAGQDRSLQGGGLLFSALLDAPVLASREVKVPAHPGMQARTAQVALRSGIVALSRPRNRPKGSPLPENVELGFVEVREVDPPSSTDCLCWRLLTTRPVATAEQAEEVVAIYRLRWRIEQVWRELKSDGLALHDSQIADAERLMHLAALALGAAVRVLQLVDARDGSSRPATDVLDAEFFPAVEAISRSREGKTERQKNPHPSGSLAWLAWITARLGGWNCYGRPPGPKTMRRGWNELAAMLAGYLIALTTIQNTKSLPGMP